MVGSGFSLITQATSRIVDETTLPTNSRPFDICEYNKMIFKFFLLLSIIEFPNIYCHELKNGLSQTEVKNACDMPKSTDNVTFCPGDKSRIEVKFKNDSTEGGILAEFKLAPITCEQEKYEIELLLDTSEHKEHVCKGSSLSEPHSLKSYIINECLSENCHNICGEIGTVPFSDVISGCYMLRIHLHLKNQGYIRYYSPWKYIKTNFTKRWKQEVTHNGHFDSKNNVILVNFTFSKSTSEVLIVYEDSKGNYIGHQDIPGDSLNSNPCHPFQERPNPGSNNRFKKIICKFDNATQTKYYFEVISVNDDHCDNITKGSKHQNERIICYSKSKRGIDFTKDKNIVTESDNGFTEIIVIVTCFVIILPVIGMMIWKLKKYMERPDGNTQLSSTPFLPVSTMNNNNEVLLLYSRDCEYFMNTMKSFKEMLEEICHVKVYNCFDDLNWEEEVTYPQHWIEKLMLNKSNLRIIIVTTECAFIQQKVHLSGIWDFNNSLFKEPTYLDKFFIYGVKHLILDQSNVVHQRIFIIRLNGFSDGVDLLSIPTASRVYQIPLHLAKLFRDMAIDDYKDDPEPENNFEKYSTYSTFVCHLNNLKIFTRSNQNYLEELLITSVNV